MAGNLPQKHDRILHSGKTDDGRQVPRFQGSGRVPR